MKELEKTKISSGPRPIKVCGRLAEQLDQAPAPGSGTNIVRARNPETAPLLFRVEDAWHNQAFYFGKKLFQFSGESCGLAT
jgi:hypothetical protein